MAQSGGKQVITKYVEAQGTIIRPYPLVVTEQITLGSIANEEREEMTGFEDQFQENIDSNSLRKNV